MVVNDAQRQVNPSNPLEAYEVAIKLAALLIFGADVSSPHQLVSMIAAVMPSDLNGFEGMYEDVKTLAHRLDDDDSPETVRWA